jgi:glycosyl hydrolase family 130 (putative beta-1,4-mannooligosaccharide phosphorylase)
LEPDECYENHGWKPGVIYSYGAVVKDGNLIVYYGGADIVVCAASCDLKTFFKALVTTEEPKLVHLQISEKELGHHGMADICPELVKCCPTRS